MKFKRILSLVWITGVFALSAQNLNKARHLNVERLGNLRSHGSEFFCYEVGREFNDNSRVLRFDSLGNILKSIPFTMGQANEIKALKLAMDGDLIYVGSARFDCPIVAMAQNSYYLVKVDTSGNQKFMIQLNGMNPNLFYFFDLIQLADSSYALCNGSQLIKVSKDGNTQTINNLSTFQIHAMEALPNGNFLAATNSGLRELTPQLSTVAQNSTSAVSVKRFGNGKIAVYNGTQQFSVLNSNLSTHTVNATTLPAGYAAFTHFDVDSNRVMLCSKDASGHMLYAVYDQNLSVLHTTTSIGADPEPSGIALNNSGRVMVIANNGFPVSSSKTYASRFNFPVFGAYQMTGDVGIEAVQLKALTTFSLGFYQMWVSANFDVNIKNYGPDTLKSVKLNHLYQSDQCTDYVNGISYSLNLAPAQNTVLSTGWVAVYPIFFPWYFGQAFNLNICWFSTIPNGANDTNLANDKFCIPVSGIVSEPELEASVYTLSVFPNPVQENLLVQGKDKGDLNVYNGLGQNILSIEKAADDLSIDCSNWAPGLYLVELKSGARLFRTKVIRP